MKEDRASLRRDVIVVDAGVDGGDRFWESLRSDVDVVL